MSACQLVRLLHNPVYKSPIWEAEVGPQQGMPTSAAQFDDYVTAVYTSWLLRNAQ
jgi:hypothetical protein